MWSLNCIECVELSWLGLEGSKLVMQLKSRPKSVGCGGGELHKSSTLLKPTEKWENLGIVRLSKLFLLVVVLLEVEFVIKASDVVQLVVIVVGSSVFPSDNLSSLSIGNISHIETSGMDMCSSWWTSDLGIIGIIVSFLHVDIGCCLMNIGGIIGIIVSFLHVDIGCCLMNIGDWTSLTGCSSPC